MRKSILTAIIFGLAFVAQADVMLWMVSNEAASSAVEDGTDVYAYLKVSDSNSNVNGSEIASLTSGQVYDLKSWGESEKTDIGSSYSGTSPAYYFYIELANGSKTAPMSYADAMSNGYIYKSALDIPTNLSTSSGFGQAPGTTYNVPEPTSGLLFLVGGMLLGLKRRRMA